jgi:uncharacterized membrane protein YhaH (DUF805 family)
MNWTWYLFRFEGRINRAKYWLAGLIILCWMIFVLMLLAGIGTAFGVGGHALAIEIFGISASLEPTSDAPASAAGWFPSLFTIPMTVLFAWCYAATSIKRLHDRDKSGWWLLPFVVLPGLFGRFGDRLADLPGGSYAVALLGLVAFVLYTWAFVEMYLLRGSPRTNRFGPDPLPKVQTRPRSGLRSGLRSASTWDQHSEIEFVPHISGPSPVSHVKRGHD